MTGCVPVTPDDSPEVLVFAEAKELLRCSESTLLACIHDGSVPAFKLGRGWRFYLRDLMAIRPADIRIEEK